MCKRIHSLHGYKLKRCLLLHVYLPTYPPWRYEQTCSLGPGIDLISWLLACPFALSSRVLSLSLQSLQLGLKVTEEDSVVGMLRAQHQLGAQRTVKLKIVKLFLDQLNLQSQHNCIDDGATLLY